MSNGLSNVEFNNIPVANSPGGAVEANEGLTVIGGFVQLGVPSSAPDASKNINVAREILFEPGASLALGGPGGVSSGNVFYYDQDNGVYIDGRETMSGQSNRFQFRSTGLHINMSNTATGILFENDFPTGVLWGQINFDGAGSFTIAALNANTMRLQAQGVANYLGDNGTGYALNLAYDSASQSTGIVLESAVQPEIAIGLLDWASPGLFSLYALNATEVAFPLQVDPVTGRLALGGGNPVSGAAINIGGSAVVPQMNFAPNGILSIDGDLDYNGTVMRMRSGGFNFNMLMSNFTINPGQIPIGWDAVSGTLTRDNSFFYDTTINIFNSGIPFRNDGTTTWIFGQYTAGAVVLDSANYIEVILNGINYKLLVAV